MQTAAALDVSEDVPVAGGVEAAARVLGFDHAPERGRFVGEMTRLVYGLDRRPDAVLALVQRLRGALSSASGGRVDLVPVPLTAAVWSDVIFHRRVTPANLVAEILGDRRAALVCHGLAALDDETLRYFAEHPSVLTQIYERNAAAFSVFAGNLHIRGDRVVPAGGDAAVPLWDAVIGQPAARADRFVPALLEHEEGRTAYLYDTVGQLDRPQAAFVLGMWLPETERIPAMSSLVLAWRKAFSDWHLTDFPFARQPYDAASLLNRVRADATGAPAAPHSRALWSHVFARASLPDDAARELAAEPDEGPIDAAWLIEAAALVDAPERRDRLDQFAFGQRVFGSAAAGDLPDVFVALRSFQRYRMLMLTFERLGIRRPSLYAAAARRASELSSLDSSREFPTMISFQGALALLARMHAVDTLDAVQTEKLVTSLVALRPVDGRYAGAVARWIEQELCAAVPKADTVEAAVVAALAGPSGGARLRHVDWEGQSYVIDFGEAERRRIERVREKQGGASLDSAVALAGVIRQLASPSGTSAAAMVHATADRLRTMATEWPIRSARAEADGLAASVAIRPSVRDLIGRIAGRLDKADVSDPNRVARAAAPLAEAADEATAQVLVSLIYAVNISDPDGSILLPGNTSYRHDFGFGARNADDRMGVPWALPRQDVTAGLAWHVHGSLLGLEVAMASLDLHRLNSDRALDAPTLSANERETFAVSAALVNAPALGDATRDAVLDAIERGRRRVVLADAGELATIVDELGVDGWRRRSLAWTLQHERGRIESLFSLGELLVLGDPAHAVDRDVWGMAAITSTGCVCTQMSQPSRWLALTGRAQLGILATAVLDLNLQIAQRLKQLALPARLAKFVLRVAVQDFVDEVRPTDPDDWMTLVSMARTMSRERIEDYVAAAAADGPLLPALPALPASPAPPASAALPALPELQSR